MQKNRLNDPRITAMQIASQQQRQAIMEASLEEQLQQERFHKEKIELEKKNHAELVKLIGSLQEQINALSTANESLVERVARIEQEMK